MEAPPEVSKARIPMWCLQGFFGAVAGALFGFVYLCFWSSGVLEDLPRTSAVGALIFMATGVVAGGWKLPEWLAGACKATCAGAVVGTLAGTFVFAPLLAPSDPYYRTPMAGKIEALYQGACVRFGGPLGAVVGLVAFALHSLTLRRDNRRVKPSPHLN